MDAPQLLRKLSRHIDQRRGIRLTADDLDLLVITGAIEALASAAMEEQRQACEERVADKRAIPFAVSSRNGEKRADQLFGSKPEAARGN